MKKIIVIVFLLLSFSVTASADVYKEQYNLSGAGKLHSTLPEDVKDFFEDMEIDPADSGWVNKLSAGNILSLMWDFLKNEGKTPIATAASAVGVILLLAAFKNFAGTELSGAMNYITAAISAGAVLVPLFSSITATARSVKAGAQFMMSFVPVYCTVLYAAGKPLTGTVSGSVLLAASEGVSALASGVITPLVGSYLAVCVCCSVSPVLKTSGVAEVMKKCANWVLCFVMTAYLGVLSLQTTVNAAADSLALRTGKFVIGSFVPVVGGPISEALTTVGSCMGLLRSSVGIYGVAVLAVILIPVVAELLLWRLCLLLSATVASVFECDGVSALLRAADGGVSFSLGILLICTVAFIISVTVLISTGG